jgi:hypothetical protein
MSATKNQTERGLQSATDFQHNKKGDLSAALEKLS